MRVLLIKTSSMGDIIHTLPALTDAAWAIPGITFDWVVEDTFAEIPAWHASVGEVIPVALRRWRRGLFSRKTWRDIRAFRKQLKHKHYDLVLDAQALVKSALLVYFTRGLRVGLDFRSAREGFASFAYQRKCRVDFYQHAIIRMRSLFSQALAYPLPTTAPDFGIKRKQFQRSPQAVADYLVFLHGTTWDTKQWPEAHWVTLSRLAGEAGFRIKMSGGNREELARAERIAQQCDHVDALPRLPMAEMATLLANAKAAVAVDTGFGHLSAALNVPTVSLYGPTNPVYTGAVGNHSTHLAADFPCAPCLQDVCHYRKPSIVTPACYSSITPERVWQAIVQTSLYSV